MKKSTPILIAGQTYSQSRFKRLGRERKVNLMEEWFRERFTDPVHELPYNSREGGYQWLDGGPISADDTVQNTFSNIASFEVMREAIDRIESDGFDWTPVRKNEPGDGIYSINEPFPDITDFEMDEKELNEDLEYLRREMISRLDRVEELILSRRPAHGGLGHNRPPNPIDIELPSEANFPAILDAVQEIRHEANDTVPQVERAETASRKLTAAAVAIAKWIADRANSQIDNAISVALGSALVVYAHDLMHALTKATQAISNWIVALSFPF